MQQSAQVLQQREVMVSAVLDSAARTGDFTTPWDRTPEVWTYYASEAEILRDLDRESRLALGAAISGAIEHGNGDLRDDVALAYQQVTSSHLSLRRVLEHHGDHPVVETTLRKERTVLQAVGLAF
jgi:hypothetical protein